MGSGFVLESDDVDSSVSSDELLDDTEGIDLYAWFWWEYDPGSSLSETSTIMISFCA